MRAFLGLIAAFALALPIQAAAQPAPIGAPSVFTVASPVGDIDYFAGRGFRFGDTGLSIGGFSTAEVDDLKGEPTTVELDSVSFLVLYEPVEPFRFFAEVELGGLAFWEPAGNDFDHDAKLVAERLYGDWSRSDAVNFRIGKFQTPVGRWNLVPAEPFVWTATDPVQLDRGFDEHQTGVALFGTLYPSGNSLRYWVYGQVVDPFDVDREDRPADRSAGARVEYDGALGDWSLGASLLASERKGEWNYLVGVDGLLQLGPVSLSAEAIFAEGGIPGRDLWSIYLQSVHDLGFHYPRLRDLYFVLRFEHFGPDGDDDSNIVDVGLTWIPKPWLNFKGGYRFSSHVTEDAFQGVTASLSVLF